MADEADKGNEIMAEDLERRIAAARGDIPPGIEGDCELCGEWFGRLIGGACAPCRDKYGLG
ncbi:MAG: conjugal transfer protein TraR [candidate division Zixibacteria bacterium]|nr:conjugal transfer protein TraR [candidate division Zixibacteria bacterium]